MINFVALTVLAVVTLAQGVALLRARNNLRWAHLQGLAAHHRVDMLMEALEERGISLPEL